MADHRERRTVGREAAGCSHDITDTMPSFVTSATYSTTGTCVRCLREQLEVSDDTARTIAARINDPCHCGIPHEDICWECVLDDGAHDPPCPEPLILSDHCDVHDFGAITQDEFDALPDWPGRAGATEQPFPDAGGDA